MLCTGEKPKMAELKTLAKSDPQFKNYLMGTFSETERALPVQSLNVSTENEVVTFSIVPVASIEQPSFVKMWAQILKLKNVVLLIFPLFLLVVKNVVDNVDFDVFLAAMSGLGALFLFLAMNLRNDSRDHVSGLDRIHPQSGSRAIQNGWITAAQAQRLSFVFAVLGLCFGAPAIVVSPQILVCIAIALAIAYFGLRNYGMGLKYRWSTELSVFILLGPLLTISYQLAIGARFDIETLILGIISGWFSVFIVHLRNFEAIMANDRAGFGNSVGFLGFEKSKGFLIGWWITLMLFTDLYHWVYAARAWAVGFILVTLGLSWLLWKNLKIVKSPVSSNFSPALGRVQQIAMLLLSVWILESMTYLLVIEIAS
jgi:1,4-dihydroxy-2-naphthoate octaprenyltransferase